MVGVLNKVLVSLPFFNDLMIPSITYFLAYNNPQNPDPTGALVTGIGSMGIQQTPPGQQPMQQPPMPLQPPMPSTTRSKRVYNTVGGAGDASGISPIQQGINSNPPSYPQQPTQTAQSQQPGSARSGFTNTPVSSQNKIDPSQIPSSVVLFQTEQEYFTANPYYTNPKRFTDSSPPSPPSSVLDYFVIDDGNCSPRFVRATTYALPTTSDLANTVAIPLGLVIQPLAKIREDEVPLQVVDFGESGPIRCSRCRGYINCHVTFIDGGRRFRCNLCSQENDGKLRLF